MPVTKRVGLVTAIALVVANMIGTGIFTSLGFQVAALPSAWVLLFLWFCGGLTALCGGLSYIQLARRLPGFGGEYHYIRQVYHPAIATAAGALSVTVGFAAPMALASLAFAAYFSQLAAVPQKLLAAGVLTLVTAFHGITIGAGSRFQQVSTLIKLLIILGFIGIGLLSPVNSTDFTFRSADLTLIPSRGFALSLVYVSFAYSGWNASVYIFRELNEPVKTVRQSILAGIFLVTTLYIALIYIFLKTAPIARHAGVIETGYLSATALLGERGATIMAGVISVLLISTISAMVWAGSRVILRMAKDHALPLLSTANHRGIPLPALLLQYVLSLTLIITGTFGQILTYAGVLLIACSSLAVSGLYHTRFKLSLRQLVAPTVFLLINGYTLYVLLFT